MTSIQVFDPALCWSMEVDEVVMNKEGKTCLIR